MGSQKASSEPETAAPHVALLRRGRAVSVLSRLVQRRGLLLQPARRSGELGSRLHLSAGRRARSDVLAGLGRALAPAAAAPPLHRQESVDSVHACDQEAKDLQRRGDRKHRNNV